MSLAAAASAAAAAVANYTATEAPACEIRYIMSMWQVHERQFWKLANLKCSA